MVLQAMHREIKKRKLPIDILVCSSTLEPDENLIVVKPISEFTLPFYKEQPIRIPNFMEIHHLFYANEYDRLICSTEGIMGLMGLYLKNAYHVKGYFYLHTDWMMFARKVLNIDRNNLNRTRRMLRAYYKGFDGLFVLNTEQKNWLHDREMAFPDDSVFLTAHWADECFKPQPSDKNKWFGVDEKTPVLLFSGRLSHEKGVMELPDIYSQAKNEIPELRLVIAGTGPVEKKLKEAIPDAIYLGWVDHEKLPDIYSSADLLILPSKFDTFSCSVLEAFSCGLPVLAYRSKGPKDLIQDQECGYLANNRSEMIQSVISYFTAPAIHKSFRNAALERASAYSCNKILDKFLTDVSLVD